MAEAVSPFGARVLEMDVSLELGLLVCGDRWGNIAAFSLPEEAVTCSGGLYLSLQCSCIPVNGLSWCQQPAVQVLGRNASESLAS